MRVIVVLLLLLMVGSPSVEGAESEYDVVVYGGTSAGVVAAVQVARMGRSVVLVAPETHLGGLTASGLGQTDAGDKSVIGGVSREFYERIQTHYQQDDAWTWQTQPSYKHFDPQAKAMWRFEPHVAEAVFEEMLTEAGVTVERDEWLQRPDGAQVEEGRIVALQTLSGNTYQAQVYIDATYEGDLMAAAGVSYTVGRESNATYDESLNGVQVEGTNERVGDKFRFVDPYKTPGDPASGVLTGIDPTGPGVEQAADHRVQAYCFRMCMTDVPENRIDWPKPKDYDESRYELLLRWCEGEQPYFPLNIAPMPNRKTDTNNNGLALMSTDYIGANYDYPEASYERRAEIVADHLSYQQGLMWTLANNPRVPEAYRNRLAKFGIAKDEFADNGNWPYSLYIREARRMVGAYVLTEHDARRTRKTPQPVGMGSYSLDSHHVQRFVDETGSARNEGNTYASTGGPYQVAYGCLTPKREECQNLLVPVCLSASHITYGSVRMEPVFMILGQSAATAAVQAVEQGMAVQEIDYERLKQQLEAHGQVLVPKGGLPRPKPK